MQMTIVKCKDNGYIYIYISVLLIIRKRKRREEKVDKSAKLILNTSRRQVKQ